MFTYIDKFLDTCRYFCKDAFLILLIEQDDLEPTIYICIWLVPGSNLAGLSAVSSSCNFSRFPRTFLGHYLRNRSLWSPSKFFLLINIEWPPMTYFNTSFNYLCKFINSTVFRSENAFVEILITQMYKMKYRIIFTNVVNKQQSLSILSHNKCLYVMTSLVNYCKILCIKKYFSVV
jgi:hypothetical protein